MSKKDLEDLLRRLAYAAYKVALNAKIDSPNPLKFRLSDYRTSCEHQKLMRRERRWANEVNAKIAALNQPANRWGRGT